MSATPTIRLYVHSSDAAAITGVSFVITGVSPAHGPVTKVMSGGPWASGTWVSYTLAPADLGWTPAAGDVLTYHGIASNGGGTTTGDESAAFTINSTSPPTITDPAAGPVVAHPQLANSLVGCSVAWTFNDPQGESQSAYQVKLYADNAGAKGTLLTGADTGKVASVGTRAVNITPTAGLVNGAYFWVGITTWDVHDAVSTEAVVKTRMAWAQYQGRLDIGATPTQWAIDHISATTPANTQIVLEYASTTGGTGQSGWVTNFASLTLRRWLHWRLWLFGWGSASPTTPSLDELAVSSTSSANVAPDNWDLTHAASKASLDISTFRYGRQSLKMTATGDSTTPWVEQTVDVRPYTTYVIQASIRALVLGGTFEAWCDLYDGAESVVATQKVTATNSDFVQVYSIPFTTGAQTTLRFRCLITDGAGSAGSSAWFDCVEVEPSSVVSPWSPGNVGRGMSIDVGGMNTDGQLGVNVRHHGSGSAANDYLEMGVHGWKLGGGPEIYSPDGTLINLGATTVSAAGLALIDDANAAAQRATLGLGTGYGEAANSNALALTPASVAASGHVTGDNIGTDSGWIAVLGGIGFANSWVNFGGAFQVARYRKDALGYVHVQGTIKSGTLNVAMFTLPAGYRPAATLQFACVSNNAHGTVQVLSTGVVQMPTSGGSNASVSLDTITFFADA